MAQHLKSKSRDFSKLIVISAVIAVVLYAVAVFGIELHDSASEIPDSLTAAWFGFWTVELVSLASIRKTKVKNNYDGGDYGESEEED